MCETWIDAHKKYDWKVDLSHFKCSTNFQGFFNRVIGSRDVISFEDIFRAVINETGPFEVAGEVCFWKNYGNHQSRNRITERLMEHLQDLNNWLVFIDALKNLSVDPSFEKFKVFRKACNQSRGFATPITFLAFYKPFEYPMVDKHIANWWRKNKTRYGLDTSPTYSQRKDGWIQTYTFSQEEQNWNAYIAWTKFCQEYAEAISTDSELNWRARDVEIAVWEAQKRGIRLNVLQ